MRDDNGKTPFGWIVTIAVVLLIIGVSVAMIYGNEFEFLNKDKQKQNQITSNTIQEETEEGIE